MHNFLDEIERAAAKLQNLGEKAVARAAAHIDGFKPTVDRAIENAKDILDNMEDGIVRAVDNVGDGVVHMVDSVGENLSRAMNDAKANFSGGRSVSAEEEAPAEDAEETPAADPVSDDRQQIDLDVEAQLNQIRSAQQTPGAFSDYISKKFGKDQQ